MLNKRYRIVCAILILLMLVFTIIAIVQPNSDSKTSTPVQVETTRTTTVASDTENIVEHLEDETEMKPEVMSTEAVTEESEEDKFMARVIEEVLYVEYSPEYKNDELVLDGEIESLEDYKTRLEQLSKTCPEGCKNEAHQIIIPELESVVSILEQYYTDKANILLWKQRAAEYPVATEVWLFMKDQGWSDAVCAGILGNMMTECGGHTLNLQWNIYDYSGWFYGLCQWHKGYYPEVQGQSLEYQLQHLVNTMEQEFGMFGSSALDRFLSMADPASAALDFAKKYERCAATDWNYTSRQNNAWVAYRYFSN